MDTTIALASETTGRRLLLLRVARRLSRRALGDRAGVSACTIGRVERDELTPHRLTIRAIEDALEVERGTLGDAT